MKMLKDLKKQFEAQLPFVVYRKPDQKELFAFFQEDDKLFFLEDYKEEGFVFAPFKTEEKTVFFSKKNCNFYSEPILNLRAFEFDTVKSTESICKEEEKAHKHLIEQGVKAINDKVFEKVVLSRKETICLKSIDLVELFQKLLQKYSEAFVYVWFHPKIGLWLGATPETLVKISGNSFETMALAGTQQFKGSLAVNWGAKEIEEQQIVTDYILNELSLVGFNLDSSELTTKRAGSLLHLHTKIKGEFTGSVETIIRKLHPTPAVCGLPKEDAKKFIIFNELYSREYYTGYLGELNFVAQNKDIKSSLYVNLRCMQIKDNKALIYVGGGITASSDIDKEWQETVAKTNTMKSVL